MLTPLDPAQFADAERLFVDAYPYRAHEIAAWRVASVEEAPQRWGMTAPDRTRLLAYVALWRVEAQKHRFDLIVQPDARRNGLGHRLLDAVLDRARDRGASTLQARALADSPASLEFLRHRGFDETMRMRSFELDLGGLPAVVRASSRAPRDAAIAIAPVTAADVADASFWTRLTALHNACRDGWPDPDPGGAALPLSADALRSLLLPATGPPLAFFLATAGSDLCGYSVLRRRHSGRAQFAATAVRPEMRRRGIATALRAECLLAATEAGCTFASSASGNDALIRINHRFGFREVRSEVRLVRRLHP